MNVDVVVVSFNSSKHIRACVEPLVDQADVRVIVVDNGSQDATLQVVAELPVEVVDLKLNCGFASACNHGWRSGNAPLVLFLNPDAVIDDASVHCLSQVLEQDARIGAVGPKLVAPDGSLQFSQRRFPRLRSAYAQAFFLHRCFPRSPWASEDVYDRALYDRSGSPECLEGACLLVRRSLLTRLGGFDERFFLYSEDIDLCLRLRALGVDVRYEPRAVCTHAGQGSGTRSLPLLTESRIRYVQKHSGRGAEAALRLALALRAIVRLLTLRGGPEARTGHIQSLRVALTPLPQRP